MSNVSQIKQNSQAVQLQFSIFDALHQIENTNNKIEFAKKLSKRVYQLTFIEMTKNLINDKITVDEYKQALHVLCEYYRNEYGPIRKVGK